MEKSTEPVEKYICLPKEYYSLNNYSLTSIRKKDIHKIKEWRNAQLNILRQKKPLSDEEQDNYYKNVIVPTYQDPFPPQILFSILQKETCIGYGGLVHISWKDKRAEISFLIDNNRVLNQNIYRDDFENYLSIVKKIAFEELALNRLFLETYDIREKHVKTIEKSGFKLEGRLKQHIIIGYRKVDSLIHGLVKEDYYGR